MPAAAGSIAGRQGADPGQEGHRASRLKKGSAGGRLSKVDYEDNKKRYVVERMFCWLKRWQVVATRFDKLQVRYRLTVQVAALDVWVKALVKAA